MENDKIIQSFLKRSLKPFNKKLLKEDVRKLGINLMTASIVGVFITHASKMTLIGSVLISSIGIAGFVFVLFGLHKATD
jgi:hypothetical protein